MKTIIIEGYPCTMSFQVRKELPEFTFDCPVRTSILHYQIKKRKIDTGFHHWSDYSVETIQILSDECEEWIIGS
jgi:hypothetical protein